MRFEIGGRIVVLAAARKPFHNQAVTRNHCIRNRRRRGASAAKWGEGWLFKSSIGSHVPSSSCWHSLFIVAVLLNFTNVVGRYLFGISLLGSDEVQVFIMVGMTFLGAVVVTPPQPAFADGCPGRSSCPPRCASLLRIAEQLLLAVLAGFVLSQSYFYARQMLRIGRTERHGRRADVDPAWRRGARICD